MIKNTKETKATIKGSTYSRRGLTYAMVGGAVVIGTCINLGIAIQSMSTISVLKVKSSAPISKSTQLSDNICESDNISRKDYKSDMILYKDREKYYSKYAKNYIRAGNDIHVDETTDVKPVRNAWLYDLASDEEVVTLTYNPNELAGQILVPGDYIYIRATYSDGSGDATKKTDKLFNGPVEVRDLLNSQKQSIYDIYDKLNAMSEANRKKAMSSSEFSSSIQPVSLMIAVPTKDAETYTELKNQKKAVFSMTLLSRSGNDSSQLDDVPILAPDVDSWVKSDQTSSSSNTTVK